MPGKNTHFILIVKIANFLFPLCTILWFKNDEIITGDEDLIIEESVIPADLDTNTFTSVL